MEKTKQQRHTSFLQGLNKSVKKRSKLNIKKILYIIPLVSALCSPLSHAVTNTGLYGDDKFAGKFPIGFAFNYYGQTFNDFYVTTNGLIQFSSPTTAYNNASLPAYNNTLYVFWDDLRTDVSGQPTGTIHYETQGEAPNRQLIIQWTNQYFYSSNIPMGTFQATLYESTNEIKYQYRYLSDERSKGSSATLGMQGANGDQISLIGYNQANLIQAEQAISFIPKGDGNGYEVNKNAEYDFIDISGLLVYPPKVVNGYTNTELAWKWEKLAKLNNYEITIQDQEGKTLYDKVIGNVDQFSYKQDLKHGNSYTAKVRGSINNGGTWEMWSILSAPIIVDTVKPTSVITSFSRLDESSVKVIYNATDDLSGVADIQLQIATDKNFTNIIAEKPLAKDVNSTVIGKLSASKTLYARIYAIDTAGNQSDYSTTVQLHIAPPTIISPVVNTIVKQPTITVTGMAEVGSEVQLYLNDKVIGTPIKVSTDGKFTTDITLQNEGAQILKAVTKNTEDTSEPSEGISFTLSVPAPKVMFITPSKDVTLSVPTDIEVNTIDELGVAKVVFDIDGITKQILTEPPYKLAWNIGTGDNGTHTIKAIVTNIGGKATTITQPVKVNVVTPEPPPTIYTGQIVSVSPETSYGLQPITITGKALYREDKTTVHDAPLKLVLAVNGFERRINLVTDEQGNFSYTFIPQDSDTGIYNVTVIHPNETKIISQASFAINRIKFAYNGYNLKAAYDIARTININATASAGAKNLRWVVRAEDQPNGKLPTGIQIEGDQGVDIAIGKAATTTINFKADTTATQTGTIFLVAFAEDSGDLIRGKLQLNYQLAQAKATLYATPAYIETGLQQGTTVSEEIEIGNKGLVSAENVTVTLMDEKGNPAPSWVFLTTNKIGELAVDEISTIQLTAQPDDKIPNGIYRFNIQLTSTSGSNGTIPVSIAVMQHGQGAVRFDVADIYTATLDEKGQPILGVNNANIKLQNEAVLTETYTAKTSSEGIALFDKLPPGIYLYRVSANDHSDVTGRIVIRPAVTTNQHIFLEYQTIHIDFSVIETTIQDIYDIELNATFNTQVPAPVVVIEPLAINLAGMQNGEEKTGELIISNYGLIQAENVVINLPKTDNQFRYEFFGEVPKTLLPKARIVIPYKVTALITTKAHTNSLKTRAVTRDANDKECNSYYAQFAVQYDSTCANGDTSHGDSSGKFYKVIGRCQGGGIGGIVGGDGTGYFGGGNWLGGNGLSTPFPMPMTSGCMPDAPGGGGGAKPADGGGANPEGGGAGPGPGPDDDGGDCESSNN